MKNIVPARFLTLFFTLNLIVFSQTSNAGLISNGDFVNGLNGWADASSPGVVAVNNGVANLAAGSGSGLYSAVLVQGDDGSFNFNTPIVIGLEHSLLKFDLWQLSRAIDSLESATSALSDHLNLSIYDAIDPSFDLLFTDFIITSQLQHFTLDISSLIGRSVAFSYELNDENDGFNSIFALDNVRLSSATVNVPEPKTVLLLLLALFLFMRTPLIVDKFRA
jgi:hypothetical protein